MEGGGADADVHQFMAAPRADGSAVEVSLRLQNVGSVQAHLAQIQDWLGTYNALLLTETRADLMRQRSSKAMLKRNCVWSAPAGTMMRHAARARLSAAKPEGVVHIANHPLMELSAKLTGDKLHDSTTRYAWSVHHLSPVCDVIICLVYGISGADSWAGKYAEAETILSNVFEAAPMFGDNPVIVCGDFNAEPHRSDVLRNAARTGCWQDLLVEFGCEDSTYIRGDQGTQIDRVYVNAAAARLVRSIYVDTTLILGSHHGVVLELLVPSVSRNIFKRRPPEPLKEPTGSRDAEPSFCDEWARAMESRDIDTLWQTWQTHALAWWHGDHEAPALTTSHVVQNCLRARDPSHGRRLRPAVKPLSFEPVSVRGTVLRKRRQRTLHLTRLLHKGGNGKEVLNLWAKVLAELARDCQLVPPSEIANNGYALRDDAPGDCHDYRALDWLQSVATWRQAVVQQHDARVKKLRLDEWRQRMRAAAHTKQKKMFSWVDDEKEAKIISLKGPDGLTFDEQEMVDLAQQKWCSDVYDHDLSDELYNEFFEVWSCYRLPWRETFWH